MDYVGPYVINIELAANKAEEAKKINLDYLVIEQVVVKNGNNYELARDLLIEIGDDLNDYLFDNYFDMSTGGIFDGCGNSITINQSYGMVNGVEVNPATLSNTRCVGQSPLFLIHSQHYSSSTSITNTIQNLGWHGTAPVGVIYQNDSNQWVHHYNSIVKGSNLGNHVYEDNYYVKLTLENIYCTRTRTPVLSNYYYKYQ